MIGRGCGMEEVLREIGVTGNTYSLEQGIWWIGTGSGSLLKDLEQENSRLKRVVADLSLDNLILKEVSSGKF
jgi:hypothetical protein